MTRLAIPTAAVAAATLAGCTYSGAYVEPPCRPTKIQPRTAQKVDTGDLRHSGVVEAALTAGGAAVPGRLLTFEVLNDDAPIYRAEATTGPDGTARVNLKRANPKAWLAIIRADEYRVSFAGDREFCGTSGDAPFER